MAGANRRRILRLPCRANQQHGVTCVSIPCRCALAPATVPAQPEGVCGVGADGDTGGRIPPKAPYPSPLAKCAVCRQTPEVGAECGNPARSDLCGGTGVTRFPTANNEIGALNSWRLPLSARATKALLNARDGNGPICAASIRGIIV